MDVTQTHVAFDLAHDSPLLSCRFSPDGRYVFAGSQDYSVCRFEIATGNKTIVPTEAWVRALAFSGDGSTLVTGGYDGRLMWWPVAGDDATATAVRSVDAHEGWIRAIAVSPDGSLLASVGNDLTVRLWNMSDGQLVRELSGHTSHVYNVAFHPSGADLATGDLMCSLIHWDVATGKQVRTWKAESLQKYDKTFVATIGGFRGMTFTTDGSRILCSGITNVSNAFAGVGNPSVVAFDWASGEQKIEHLSKGKIRGVAWGVVAHPDGTVIGATGGSGGFLLFWKPDEAEEFHNVKLKDVARDLDLSPDGLHLATPHFNGHVYVSRMDRKAEG
ncbi:MAG: hypothetical protein RIK87_08720 [Fuerstiella sp.]